MKITEQRLKDLGFKLSPCNDGIMGWSKNNFIWVNEWQIRYNKCEENAILINDNGKPGINTVSKLSKMYWLITGDSIKQ